MPKHEKVKEDQRLRQLRQRIAKAPMKPGIYRWLDAKGNLLYIGKAKNLRGRLRSYVQEKAVFGPWKQMMVLQIADVDYSVTGSELEALILETNLIKEHKPKYNVMMKDDKNYVYVRISMHDPYPAVTVVRRIEEDGARYFGPFVSSRDMKQTLEMLHDIFQYQACRESIEALNRHAQNDNGKEAPVRHAPCLESQIGKCNGLCTGAISREEYRSAMEEIVHFLKGKHDHVLTKLAAMMQEAAAGKKFERAARLRDTFLHIQSLEAQQIVSDTSGANTDVIGIAMRAGRSQVVVLRERGGKLIGELAFALAGQAETAREILSQFLPQYYSEIPDLPETILCAEEPEGKEALEQWLSGRHGKTVTISVPERGKKSRLLTMAQENASGKIDQQFAKWEAAEQKVGSALEELKESLKLRELPKRIECYDISHLDGTETVGSMAVFIQGKPRNADYRSFTLRTIKKGEIDDYKALAEVLRRRIAHLQRARDIEDAYLANERILIRKARKADLPALEELLTSEHLDTEELATTSFFIAVQENEGVEYPIGCCRIRTHETGLRELSSIWIHPGQRGKRLGHLLIRRILRTVKSGKVYLCCHESLYPYYASLGFEQIRAIPPALEEKMARVCTESDEPIVMTYDTTKNKPDTSLQSVPDLIVFDGGKGQLSTGVDVLRGAGIEIPIIGLAKREEEVFIPASPDPLLFPKDSEGRFLLMHIRDEAHRFANRHREKRQSKAMLS